MHREHVEAFFDTGELLLGSFARFSAHSDEQRLDADEGKTTLVHRTAANGGQTLIVNADFGHDAYILSGSTLPSHDLMRDFGCDSGFVIKDPARFALAIAASVKGFVRGFDGPCSYQLRRIIEHDLGWIDLGPTEETSDINSFVPDALSSALSRLTSADVYFLKHHRYVAQAEWRFVWLVDHIAAHHLIVHAPDAVQFCERWDGQGEVVAFGVERA